MDDILGEGSDESDSEKKKPEEKGEKPQMSATETLGMKTDQRPRSSSSSSSSERSLTGSVPRYEFLKCKKKHYDISLPLCTIRYDFNKAVFMFC